MTPRPGLTALLRMVASAALLPAYGLAASPAHEGHGREALRSSPLHYLTEPEHALPIAAALSFATLGVLWFRRRSRSRARLRS